MPAHKGRIGTAFRVKIPEFFLVRAARTLVWPYNPLQSVKKGLPLHGPWCNNIGPRNALANFRFR